MAVFVVGSPVQTSFLARALESQAPLQSAGWCSSGRQSSLPARAGVVTCATKSFEAVAIRSRKRRRGRRGSGGDSSEEDGLSWGSGGDGGFGGSSWGGSGGGNWGSGGWSWGGKGGSGGYSEGAFHFQKALYECLWFWQIMCGLSLLQALHFVLVGEQKNAGTSAATASVTMGSAVHHPRTATADRD